MDPRRSAFRHVLYTTGLTLGCVGVAFILLREKPVYGWLAPFVIGCALALYGIGGMLRSLRAGRWHAVRGTVVTSELREVFVPGETGGYTEYLPAVRTQYRIGECTFVTERYSLVEGDFRVARTKAQELLMQYPAGAHVDVYVSPVDPKFACLRPLPSPRRRSQYLAGILGGVLVAGIALWAYAQA